MSKALLYLEPLDILEQLTGERGEINFSNRHPSDQKVYISNILKAKQKLEWSSKVNSRKRAKKLVDWSSENKHLFK